MTKQLYTIGDSFTAGTELEDHTKAWPYRLGEILGYEVVNDALPGASNDYILRRCVEYCDDADPDLVIVAWTTPHRIEIGNNHHTPNTSPQLFADWNEPWAQAKFEMQYKLLDTYFLLNMMSDKDYRCLVTWEDPIESSNYIGRLVDWAYGYPHGPGGHPLELAHSIIADNIYEKL